MGSAYIFKRNGSTWIEEAKLQASDGVARDCFGYSVSIDGVYTIIGAEGNDNKKGAAYIFKRDDSTWTQHAKLTASDGEIDNRFGHSVSIDCDYVVIGAYLDDDNGWESGSVYIFKRYGNVWIQEQKLTASDGESEDIFGTSVSIDEDYVVIGAPGANNHLGTAYIFKCNDSIWVEEAILTVSDSDIGFCFSVSIDGKYVVIGDFYGNSEFTNRCGSAYIFKRDDSTWTQHAKLTASDGEEYDWFGISVCIDGKQVIVGANSDGDNGICSGSAYIFKRYGLIWEEVSKITASDGAKLDFFGEGVSIDGDYAIVGAIFDDDNGDESGSAYIFIRNQPPSKPVINGQTNGKVGIEYYYTFNSSDSDDDGFMYIVSWGDGSSPEVVSSSPSGEGVVSHIWNKTGNYTITACAEDVNGLIGPEGTLAVTMPRTRAIIGPVWLRFFDMFPILQRMLDLIN
jgi:hypothetical protein